MSDPISHAVVKYSMRDRERSAHGLGYEYHRRGRSIERNPFPTESQRWSWFRAGWQSRRQQELAKLKDKHDGV